jgi:hypothetical protein
MPIPDQLAQAPYSTPEEVYKLDPDDVAQMQLEGLQARFEELRPELPVVSSLASDVGVERISKLEDVVPLCLPHTIYKSYSASYVDNGRYDRLTEWLGEFTTEDLTGIDVTACDSLESWVDTLEASSRLKPSVSWGTTGKVSFFPRSTVEADVFARYMIQALSGPRDEPDSGLAHGTADWFSAVPMASGRHGMLRMLNLIVEHCYGGDQSRMHSLGRMHWDADMLWLSGKLRAAESRGETAQFELTPALTRIRDSIVEAQRLAADNTGQFLDELLIAQKNKGVILFGPLPSLIDLAGECQRRGLEPDFSSGCFIVTGGGRKGQVFPDGWEALLHGVFPPPFQEVYGMTEMTGVCRLCPAGWFHWPPTAVTIQVDHQTGEPMPRIGVQTGRLAIFDLCAETHWGGTITGDRVTMAWDGECPCGRRGPRVKNDVARYSELRDDDKISCAKSPGAYERVANELGALS